MKFCQKETHVKPKDLSGCYRVMGCRAYFQDGLTAFFYEFSQSDLRKMQMERVRDNMKSGHVDDWECCNNAGEWSGDIYQKLKFQRMPREEKEALEKFKRLSSLCENELSPFENEWLLENGKYESAI